MTLEQVFIYSIMYIDLFLISFLLLSYVQNFKKIQNPKPKKLPLVTIGIPVYNGSDYLNKTMDSLLALDYPKKLLELIIVNDGSTDDTLQIANSYKKFGVRVITQKNAGKGHALNKALKYARGEIFGCLDVDSFVNSNALLKMVGYFQNPTVAAVTPALKVLNPKTILQKVQAVEFLLGVYLRKAFSFIGSIHVTPGPFTLYRKEFFDKYGGYDQDNLTEDIEIALRIQSNHYVIENAVDASVYTMGVTKFRPLLKQRLRWYKGFLDNVSQYSHLFSKKYGNLGLFILPSAFFSILLAIGVTLWAIIRTLKFSFYYFLDLKAINFDLISMMRSPELFYLSIDGIAILSLVSLAFAITTIILAKILSDEKQKIKIAYIYFLLIYFILFSYWWIIAIFYKVTGKKIRWGGRNL